jgi:hypothetical protein
MDRANKKVAALAIQQPFSFFFFSYLFSQADASSD